MPPEIDCICNYPFVKSQAVVFFQGEISSPDKARPKCVTGGHSVGIPLNAEFAPTEGRKGRVRALTATFFGGLSQIPYVS